MTLNIGEQIRKHRRALDLTQEQLAERLGVSFQAVSRWENGAAYPDIELLPVLAELFETSVDKLMGLDEAEKDRQAHQAISDFLNACDESEPIEKLVEMLKGIRRDHIASKHIKLLFWHWMEPYENPEVLAELRKIADERLKNYPDRAIDEEIIVYMANYEDEEHAAELIKTHCTNYNMQKSNMYYTRYSFRDEYDKLEPYRQSKIFHEVQDLTHNTMWINYGIPRDVEYSYKVNTFLFDTLNSFCGHTSDPEHPISGNGEVDLFIWDRVYQGMRRSCYEATLGNPEQAFVILEDAVSLLEKIMSLPDGTKIGTTSVFIPNVTATLKHEDRPKLGTFLGGPTAWLVMDDSEVEDDYVVQVQPRDFLQPFVLPGHWEWFDPIRNDPRFLEYTERIKALSGDK